MVSQRNREFCDSGISTSSSKILPLHESSPTTFRIASSTNIRPISWELASSVCASLLRTREEDDIGGSRRSVVLVDLGSNWR
jgi:hypothetical protein